VLANNTWSESLIRRPLNKGRTENKKHKIIIMDNNKRQQNKSMLKYQVALRYIG
jgi:hypothetical protein